MAQLQSNGRALLMVGAIFAGLYLTRDSTVNQPAPDFSLPETMGRHVGLASYHGRPVLLVFWMTSCGICRHELPLLSQLAPELQRKGIDVLAIHLGDAEAASDYMSSNHIGLRSLADPEGSVGQAYHVSGVPKLVLIGSDGKIKRTTAGWADESVLRNWVDAAGGT